MKLKGDDTVNHSLDSRLERESLWKKKSSSVAEADKIFKDIVAKQNITLPIQQTPRDKNASIKKAKREGNKTINEDTFAAWNNRVKKLTLQGDFANLLVEEKSNIGWKTIRNNTPK